MSIVCRAFVVGDDVSTDLIHPPDAFSTDPEMSGAGFMRGVCPNWAAEETRGALVLAGENFGCGSSREVAASVFLHKGIRMVLARSFARIFYRNLINLGMPVAELLESPPWPTGVLQRVELDETAGWLEADGRRLGFRPAQPFVQRIIEAGGLLNLLSCWTPDHD